MNVASFPPAGKHDAAVNETQLRDTRNLAQMIFSGELCTVESRALWQKHESCARAIIDCISREVQCFHPEENSDVSFDDVLGVDGPIANEDVTVAFCMQSPCVIVTVRIAYAHRNG